MALLEQPPIPVRICNVLCQLGAKPETTGFYFSAVALELVCDQPQRATLVTKWLYPDVARVYKTSVAAVERGIRMTAETVGEAQTELAQELFPGGIYPTASHFISRVAMYLNNEDAE